MIRKLGNETSKWNLEGGLLMNRRLKNETWKLEGLKEEVNGRWELEEKEKKEAAKKKGLTAKKGVDAYVALGLYTCI